LNLDPTRVWPCEVLWYKGARRRRGGIEAMIMSLNRETEKEKTYLRPGEENTKNLGHSNSNYHKNHRTEETNQQEDLEAHRS
jgi:hypothetical protein